MCWLSPRLPWTQYARITANRKVRLRFRTDRRRPNSFSFRLPAGQDADSSAFRNLL